jgi:hypothetical protein
MFQDGHKIHKEKVYPKFQMAVEKHSSDGAAVAWIMYNHLKEACIQGLFEYFDDWSLHDCDSSEEGMLEGFLGFLTAYPNYVSEYQECWFDSVTFYIKEFIHINRDQFSSLNTTKYIKEGYDPFLTMLVDCLHVISQGIFGFAGQIYMRNFCCFCWWSGIQSSLTLWAVCVVFFCNCPLHSTRTINRSPFHIRFSTPVNDLLFFYLLGTL